MLNKWRRVQYLDDGVSSYQCLACGKGWNSTSSPSDYGWKYCPHCGLEWEDEHDCREHGHRQYDAYSKMTEEQHKTQSRKREENEQEWTIQSRVLNKEGEVIRDWEWYHDWSHDYPVELYKDDSPLRMAKFAAHNLRRVRELNKSQNKDEWGWTTEYRMVLLKPAKGRSFYDYNKKEVVRILT